MIPGEKKYKWVHQDIEVEMAYGANRFEVIRNPNDKEDCEQLFIPIPAFLAILEYCKKEHPYLLVGEK